MASWQPADSLELDIYYILIPKKENVPNLEKQNAIMSDSDRLSRMRLLDRILKINRGK